mmetsp:Transcript_28742/g.65139  ORF Transcript_28742/g.65139 Transcript_28742/m.65139 type:complete len:253 (-) Transcript_28742:5706-6464(-)
MLIFAPSSLASPATSMPWRTLRRSKGTCETSRVVRMVPEVSGRSRVRALDGSSTCRIVFPSCDVAERNWRPSGTLTNELSKLRPSGWPTSPSLTVCSNMTPPAACKLPSNVTLKSVEGKLPAVRSEPDASGSTRREDGRLRLEGDRTVLVPLACALPENFIASRPLMGVSSVMDDKLSTSPNLTSPCVCSTPATVPWVRTLRSLRFDMRSAVSMVPEMSSRRKTASPMPWSTCRVVRDCSAAENLKERESWM